MMNTLVYVIALAIFAYAVVVLEPSSMDRVEAMVSAVFVLLGAVYWGGRDT